MPLSPRFRPLAVFALALAATACHRKAERTEVARDPVRAAPPAAAPAPPPAPAVPPGEHPLLVVDWDEEGGAAAEVVGYFGGAKMREVRQDSAALDSLYTRVLDAGHRYTLLVAGRPGGAATVRDNDLQGCAAATATMQVQGARPSPPFALATDFVPPPGAPMRRAATAVQLAAITPLLRDALAAKGAGWLPGTVVEAVAVPLPDGHTVLVGWAETREKGSDTAEPPEAAAFVIAENPGTGYRAAYTWTRTQPYQDDGETPQSRMLVDAADLDGDGVPELVARSAFTEAWGYVVYRRAATGWAEALSASGGGC